MGLTTDKTKRRLVKRAYPRHLKRFRARYREPGGSWRTVFTKDVSVAGLFILSSRLPKSPDVEVEIEIDKETTVTLTAICRHGARVPSHMARLIKGGFGVRITHAPPTWYEYCLSLDKKRPPRLG